MVETDRRAWYRCELGLSTPSIARTKRSNRTVMVKVPQHRYWVVKGRPSRNDLGAMLVPGRCQPWVTRKPPAAWKPGDRLLFWKSSPARELMGLGELVAVRAPRNGATTFEVRYLTPSLSCTVGIDELRRDRDVAGASFLKAGPATTVFPLSAKQARKLVSLLARRNPGPSLARVAQQWLKELGGALREPPLRVLSIRPPWAEAILCGQKDVENRTWSLPTDQLGRWIVVHASAGKPTKKELARLHELAARGSTLAMQADFERGAIVGFVRVVRVATQSRSRWFEGEPSRAWILADPVRLTTPIPCKGSLRLWRAPRSVVAKLPNLDRLQA